MNKCNSLRKQCYGQTLILQQLSGYFMTLLNLCSVELDYSRITVNGESRKKFNALHSWYSPGGTDKNHQKPQSE